MKKIILLFSTTKKNIIKCCIYTLLCFCSCNSSNQNEFIGKWSIKEPVKGRHEKISFRTRNLEYEDNITKFNVEITDKKLYITTTIDNRNESTEAFDYSVDNDRLIVENANADAWLVPTIWKLQEDNTILLAHKDSKLKADLITDTYLTDFVLYKN